MEAVKAVGAISSWINFFFIGTVVSWMVDLWGAVARGFVIESGASRDGLPGR